MAELWPMLLSAQNNSHGIPDKLIELKRQEMKTVKADAEKMQKFQSNIQNIQETLKKGNQLYTILLYMSIQHTFQAEETKEKKQKLDRKDPSGEEKTETGEKGKETEEEAEADRRNDQEVGIENINIDLDPVKGTLETLRLSLIY